MTPNGGNLRTKNAESRFYSANGKTIDNQVKG